MSAYYYLSCTGQTDFELDTTAITMTLPQIDRRYTAIDLFSNRSIITGTGSLKPGQIQFTMKFKKAYFVGGTHYSTATAWNDFRKAVMVYMGMAKQLPVYFNVIDSYGNHLMQRVYPMSWGSENYSKIWISDDVSFSLQMEGAYFYNVTANSSIYSPTTTTQEIFSVTNSGELDVPPMFTFVPSTSFSKLQIQLYYGNYGFTLSTSFISGQPITFDCATGIVTVNGNIVTGIQSAGSIFNVPVGVVSLYITACAGTLTTTFNERYF